MGTFVRTILPREERLFKFLKKYGQKETNIASILPSREPLKNNYSQTAPKRQTPTTSDAAKLTKSNQILAGFLPSSAEKFENVRKTKIF